MRAKLLGVFVALLFLSMSSFAKTPLWGWCEQGGVTLTVAGVGKIVPQVQSSFVGCTVSVFLTGSTTPAIIYSNDTGTPQTNPFTADPHTGYWHFYIDYCVRVDVRLSSGGLTAPFTLHDYSPAPCTGQNLHGIALNPNTLWNSLSEFVTQPATPPALSAYWTTAQFQMNVAAGGVNLMYSDSPDGFNYYAKSRYSPNYSMTFKSTPGIQAALFGVNYQFSTGDAWNNLASICYGGFLTPGEEGCMGADIQALQGSQAYQGTIASGGTSGSKNISISPTAGGASDCSHALCTQGDERYLIDTVPGKVYSTGTISAISSTAPPVLTGSGTAWGTSTVNTTTTGAITTPGTQTVSVGSTFGITPGSTVLLVADGRHFETVIPTAVGSGTITATFRYPHDGGAYVTTPYDCAGQFIELTADTAPAAITRGTDLRQAWPVISCSGGTSLTIWDTRQGLYKAVSSGLGTHWSSGGINTYKLYQGAIGTPLPLPSGVISNTFRLMPNGANWGAADTVEQSQNPAMQIQSGHINVQCWWASNRCWGPYVTLMGVQGDQSRGMLIENATPTSEYNEGGGGVLSPPIGLWVQGPFSTVLPIYGYGNRTQGLVMHGKTHGSTGLVYPVGVFPVTCSSGTCTRNGFADYLEYDDGAKTWALTTGSQTTRLTFFPRGTFSALPRCSGEIEGSSAAVTDSTGRTWGATVTGGGSYHVKAYCDGSHWTVEAM